MLGLASLQRATLTANADAMQYTVGASLAQTWIERLERDAAAWNHPTTTVASDDTVCPPNGKDIAQTPGSGPCSGTVWLGQVETNPNVWFVPSSQYPSATAAPLVMNQASATLDGAPTSTLANIVYCVNIRLSYIVPDQVIRADVRVFWPKRNHGDLTTFGIAPATPCPTDPAILNTTSGIGPDDTDFHWVYTTDQVQKVLPQ
jgi:hypothetical protein